VDNGKKPWLLSYFKTPHGHSLTQFDVNSSRNGFANSIFLKLILGIGQNFTRQ
jgi:hypothetical protein